MADDFRMSELVTLAPRLRSQLTPSKEFLWLTDAKASFDSFFRLVTQVKKSIYSDYVAHSTVSLTKCQVWYC